jgi:polyhydroxyalkanoate synthesis regulator protein
VLVREGEDVQVIDRSSGEDLTAVTLSQVVLDSERKRHGAVPEALLQQIVRAPTEAISEAVRAGQDLFQKAEERVVREPQAALAEARKTLQGLKIPNQKDLDRLERRLRDLSARVERLADVISRLDSSSDLKRKPAPRRRKKR